MRSTRGFGENTSGIGEGADGADEGPSSPSRSRFPLMLSASMDQSPGSVSSTSSSDSRSSSSADEFEDTEETSIWPIRLDGRRTGRLSPSAREDAQSKMRLEVGCVSTSVHESGRAIMA